jgi:hypothetical protein
LFPPSDICLPTKSTEYRVHSKADRTIPYLTNQPTTPLQLPLSPTYQYPFVATLLLLLRPTSHHHHHHRDQPAARLYLTSSLPCFPPQKTDGAYNHYRTLTRPLTSTLPDGALTHSTSRTRPRSRSKLVVTVAEGKGLIVPPPKRRPPIRSPGLGNPVPILQHLHPAPPPNRYKSLSYLHFLSIYPQPLHPFGTTSCLQPDPQIW